MKLELENVDCNLCGSNNYDVFLCREDLNTFLQGDFRLVRCNKCGLVYQNPRPSLNSWDVIYPEDYDQYTVNSHIEYSRNFLYRYGFRKRILAIEKFKKGGNLCDVGCATGDFLREINMYSNWQGYGIEPNNFASDLARKAGLTIHTGTLLDQPFPDINFDVITLWNVIEHLPNPLETLQYAYNRLNPGGILVFTTPNLDSFDAHFFGKYWIGYELPRHFYVFSTQILIKYLRETNFKLVGTKCLYGEHAAAMSSVRFWLRAKYPSLSKSFHKVLFMFPIRILLAPIFFVLDKLKKSSPITIFAQKF